MEGKYGTHNLAKHTTIPFIINILSFESKHTFLTTCSELNSICIEIYW